MIRDQHTARARLLACAAALAVSALIAPAAQAANLIGIEGDPEVYLDGTFSYDIVYLDGPDLHLAGNVVINAREVILGPNTAIDSCALPPANANCPADTSSRSLTISAIGGVSIAGGISLIPQGNGFGAPLSLSGGSVSVSGPITTMGTSGAGAVSISSATVTGVGDITASGAPVVLTGGTGVLAGAITTSNGQPGGSVTIASGAGDALVGAITASGRDGAAGGPGSGGGTVTINAGDVRVGAIDVTGGNGSGTAPGAAAGSVGIAARGGLSALGTIDVSGSNGAGGAEGSAGGRAELSAGGHASVAGINAFGGAGTTAGGVAIIRAASAAVGNVNVFGGTPGVGPAAGGVGGGFALTAPGTVTIGGVNAAGGNANGAAGGGHGGSVVASAGLLTVGAVATSAGTSGGGAPGIAGGNVALTGETGLTLGGTLTTRGSDAGATANSPPQPGGTGGVVSLRAIAGNLALAGVVRTRGGRGGTAAAGLGASGGAGGPVDLVGRIVAPLTGIDTSGGDGGGAAANQGPGGPGGSIRAFTRTAVFDGLLVISSTGGDGTPAGPAGGQSQNMAPSGLTIDAAGVLSFASQSPLANGYRVLRTVGDKTTAVLDTAVTAKVAPPTPPLCTEVVYSVVAFRVDVGWISDGTQAIKFTRQPSGGSCIVAPKLTSPTLERRVKFLKRGAWKLKLRLQAGGVGSVEVALLPGRKPLPRPKGTKKPDTGSNEKNSVAATPGRKKAAPVPVALGTRAIAGRGPVTMTVKLPKAARRTGIYRLRITGKPLVGTKTTVTTITLEVSE